MKSVPCTYKDCGLRRMHYETEQLRGTQLVDVPDDFVGVRYCSIECAVYDGYFSGGGLRLHKETE